MKLSNFSKKKKRETKHDKRTVTCDVGRTAQYRDGAVKCEKKNKRTIKCDKSAVKCDVRTA